MDNTYHPIKEKEHLDFLGINAVFSAIYTPHTPASTNKEDLTRHYKERENDFYVMDNEKGALIKGHLSQGLLNKLKDFGIELKPVN